MQQQIVKNNQRMAYWEQGSGDAVLLLHCSSANHREWRGVEKTLGQGFKIVTPDFFGYGESQSYQPWELGANPDLECCLELLDKFDGQIHLVGHSYGGGKALQIAIERPEKLRSLTLIEPTAFYLMSQDKNQFHYEEISAVAQAMRNSIESGDNKSAARDFISYWQSLEEWNALSPLQQRHIANTMPKVIREFADIQLDNIDVEELSNLEIPVHIIKGSKTRSIIDEITSMLLCRLSRVKYSVVDGAGHMLPMTHQAEVFELIAREVVANRQEDTEVEIQSRQQSMAV